MMEVPSSSKPRDGFVPEELELEDVLSELRVLKKLYGVLQKNSVKSPNVADSHDSLDEKSRVLLKKLLDGATHQALQCQAKILCYTPESPPTPEKVNRETKISLEAVQKEVNNPEVFQKCHPVVAHHGKAEATQSISPQGEPTPSHQQQKIPGRFPVAEPEISQNPCPTPGRRDLKRQNSRKSTAISDEKLLRHQHRQIPLDRDPVISDRLSKPRARNTETQNRARSTVKNIVRVPEDYGVKSVLDPNTQMKPHQMNGGHLLAVVPAQKRARVGAKDLFGPATSRTRVESRVELELTHSKGSGLAKSKGGTGELPCRTGSLKDKGTKSIVLRDHTAMIGQGRKNCMDQRKTGVVRRKEERDRLTGPEKLPSHRMHPSQEHRKLSRESSCCTKGATMDRLATDPKKHPPRTPRRMKSIRYSSQSQTNRSNSSQSRETDRTATSDTAPNKRTVVRRSTKAGPSLPTNDERLPRRIPRSHALVASRAGPARRRSPHRRIASSQQTLQEKPPRRMLSHHRMVGLPRKPAEKATADQKKKPENQEGRLKRFKNKLAIIFHHHHHHHHHLHDGRVASDDAEVHHRSPWKYLRRILHHTNGEEHGKLAKAAASGPPAQHRHGYLYALLEGLLRHVWGMRKRKKVQAERGRLGKTTSRVRVKKLHWWHRFKRRSGVKLACKKKPRLRLAFTRPRSRTTKNKIC